MHSQNNEEKIIADYFVDRIGCFLDIGANDGKTLSNTYALAQKGWAGVCVEASPKAFQRLVNTYADNCKIEPIHMAVGSYDGEIVLHESGELLGVGDTSLVSSTKENEVKRWNSVNMQFTDITVPCCMFKSLLDLTLLKTFDFISLDIEGMELEVLPQIPFKALGIKLACIEFNGNDQHLYSQIMQIQGFRLIHKNQENLIYAI